jgi:hypothetical protein
MLNKDKYPKGEKREIREALRYSFQQCIHGLIGSPRLNVKNVVLNSFKQKERRKSRFYFHILKCRNKALQNNGGLVR